MFSEVELERAEKREQRSQEYKKRYVAGDENALREFCRIDPFAIKTQWVQKSIEQCLLTGNMEPLKNLYTTGKREKKHPATIMTDILIVKILIDLLVKETGLPRSVPKYCADGEKIENKTVFSYAADNQLFTYGKVQRLESRSLYNLYYHEMRNQEPYIMIEMTKYGVIQRCGPTLISNQERYCIGFWERFIPAGGGEEKLSVNAVFNIPSGKNIYDICPIVLNCDK